MNIIGGFGSAGAGNRTGRHVMTRGGQSTTPQERLRRNGMDQATGLPLPTEADRDEFMANLREMRCWWCGRDRNKDGRRWRALSQHWQKAHLIDLREIREYLKVPKSTGFVSDDLHERFSQRSRAAYDPSKLRHHGGRTYTISRYARDAMRQRAMLR